MSKAVDRNGHSVWPVVDVSVEFVGQVGAGHVLYWLTRVVLGAVA